MHTSHNAMPIDSVIRLLVKIALIGRTREIRNQCVYFNSDYASNPVKIEIDRLLSALDKKDVVKTEYEDLNDLLAFVRQTARIPLDTWKAVLHPIATPV